MKKQLYECDPNKNVDCSKRTCMHNPKAKYKVCGRTSNIKFASKQKFDERRKGSMPKWQNEFAIQLMAKGSFVDSGVGNGCSYLVEAFTIRLNHIAMNAWILSEMMDSRDCYSTDDEWEAHKVEYKAKRKSVHELILKALDIDPNAGGISIKQVQSEVFSVVRISELNVSE